MGAPDKIWSPNKETLRKRRAYRHTRLPVAIEQAEAALALGKDDAETHLLLGFLYFQAKRWSDAAKHLGQAESLGHLRYLNYQRLAICSIMMDRINDARGFMALANLGCPTKSGKVALARAFGRTFRDKLYYADAIESFRDSLELDFSTAGIRRELGETALAAKHFPLALWAYRESYRVDGQSPVDLFGMGRVLYAMQEDARSEKLIATAIE